MASAKNTIQYWCGICGKEAFLETCKIDERGYIVHEDCYALRILLETDSSRRMDFWTTARKIIAFAIHRAAERRRGSGP